MARSDIFTLIPLDFWAQVYGVDPYRFNQVRHTDETPECDPIWCQSAPGFGPQGRFHVRDDLARALFDAEVGIEKFLGSPVAPDWVSREVDLAYGSGLFETPDYRVLQFGQPLWTLLGDYLDYPVVYSGDWGAVTVPAADYSGPLCELWLIAPGYPSADGRKSYAIRPVRWHRDNAGNSVGRAHKAQFVVPSLWDTCIELDANDSDTWLDYAEVWRVSRGVGASYPAATIHYVTTPEGCEAALCGETTQDSCAAVQTALGGERGRGIVYPAAYNAVTAQWELSTCPTGYRARAFTLYYQAGVTPIRALYCEPYERRLAEAVARLATAYLPHSPCGCDAVAEMFQHDRMWMSATGEAMSAPADPYAYRNPLGNTWAAQNAWHVLDSIRPNRVREGGRI